MFTSNSGKHFSSLLVIMGFDIAIPQISYTWLLSLLLPLIFFIVALLFYITGVSPYLHFHIILNQADIVFGRNDVLIGLIFIDSVKLYRSLVLAVLKL
jgi:hypothetical protein